MGGVRSFFLPWKAESKRERELGREAGRTNQHTHTPALQRLETLSLVLSLPRQKSGKRRERERDRERERERER